MSTFAQSDVGTITGFVRDQSGAIVPNALEPNSTVALDGNLAVGATTETIEVSSSADVLQTESGSVQSEVTGTQIQDLELNGRSPIYSAQFLPGIRSSSTLGDKQGLGPAGQPFSINGARSWDTMVTVDGAPALRTRSNGAVIPRFALFRKAARRISMALCTNTSRIPT